MEIIIKKLGERRGEISIHLAIILILSVLILSAALEVHHVYATIDGVIDKTDAAVLAVAAHNVPEISAGVREGSGTARRFVAGTGWAELVSTQDVIDTLGKSLGVTPGGSTLEKPGSYRITNLHTTYRNSDGGTLNFTTTMTVEVRLSLGGKLLPSIRAPLEVQTTYEAKF